MLWRYNPLKRELQFFDQASNRILCFELALLKEAGWKNCDHVNLAKSLPTSTR